MATNNPMTPTDFLSQAAKLMDERAELRPMRTVHSQKMSGLVLRDWLHLVHDDDESHYWSWGSGDGVVLRDNVTTYDARAHIIAFWAEKVAEHGTVIYRALDHWQVADDHGVVRVEFPTYLAALLAAVKATIQDS